MSARGSRRPSAPSPRARRAARAAVVSLVACCYPLVALSGCGPGEPPLCRPDAPPALPERPNLRLSLGDEAEPFVPYRDGSEARLVRGPQGGFMLLLRVVLQGGPAERSVCGRLRLELEAPDGTSVASLQEQRRTTFSSEGRATWPDNRLLLGFSRDEWLGYRGTLRARFEADGWLGERSVAITITE